MDVGMCVGTRQSEMVAGGNREDGNERVREGGGGGGGRVKIRLWERMSSERVSVGGQGTGTTLGGLMMEGV